MNCRRGQSGFAATVALFMIVLVIAAILAVTTLMGADVKDSTQAQIDAQLRQLLFAAALEAPRTGAQTDSRNIALPDELSQSGARLQIRSVMSKDSQTLQVTVEAQFAQQRGTQLLHFVRHADRWVCEWAELQ